MVGFLLMEEESQSQVKKKSIIQMNWMPSLLKRKNSSPLGLRNLGNSCYLNSVLQCLTFTPALANSCLALKHSSICDSASDPYKKRECPFCLLEKRIVRSHSIELPIDSPAKIFSCLRLFCENFKSGRQEDAHEFLRYVIDVCHNTCLRLKKLQQQLAKKSSNGNGPENFGTNSIVKDIFGGALQSQVKCLVCGNESNKVDEIMDVCLEISGCSSVKDAMKNFFQAEILDGNNKYNCERCKKLVPAKKQMSVLQAPNVLVVQLKRFEGMFGRKIDKAIAFEEILVLSSFMCKASQDPHPEYSLFATIVHSGFSPESGHYYAYVKDAIGRWYCCNDSYVSLSTLQEMLTEKAYILFFTRTSQRPVPADTATVSNGVKSHLMPNGVKSHASNGKTKNTTPMTAVNTNSSISPLFGKVVPIASKVNGAHTGLRNKFNGFANSVAKKDSPCDNETVDLQKKESIESNGNMGHKVSKHMNGNGKCLIAHDNGNHVNGEQNNVDSTKDLVNSNGIIQNGHEGFQKENLHKDNTLSKEEIVVKAPINGTNPNDLRDGPVNISGTKRKFEDKDSCILLAKDAQSQARVDKFKEVLQKDASSALQSSGWLDKLYKHMRSRKRLCMDTCISTDTDEQKKVLIADAKASFISQIPGSLKASLVERIRTFSRGK